MRVKNGGYGTSLDSSCQTLLNEPEHIMLQGFNKFSGRKKRSLTLKRWPEDKGTEINRSLKAQYVKFREVLSFSDLWPN